MNTLKRAVPILLYGAVVGVLWWLAANNNDFSFYFYAATFPWSLVLLLLDQDTAAQILVFITLPLYILNSLLIYYWANRKTYTSVVSRFSESTLVGMYVAVGYLFWAVPLLYYAMTCTGKFCGLAFIPAASPGAFLLEPFQPLFDGIGDNWAPGILIIALNLLITFLATKVVVWFLARKKARLGSTI